MVLKKTIDDDAALEITDSKKSKLFTSLLSSVKKKDVHVHSLALYYECIMIASGRYSADYYRMATGTISVDSNVKEVVLGDAVFSTRTKSFLEKVVVGKRGKNKIELKFEEHVFVSKEDVIRFNHHGQEIELEYKTDSDSVENYPQRILSKNKANLRESEITFDDVLSALKDRLKEPVEEDVRDVNEEFVLDEIMKVYVPVFEARLVGPKKKVRVLRFDAVTKKII